jgi:hypothetical protein
MLGDNRICEQPSQCSVFLIGFVEYKIQRNEWQETKPGEVERGSDAVERIDIRFNQTVEVTVDSWRRCRRTKEMGLKITDAVCDPKELPLKGHAHGCSG